MQLIIALLYAFGFLLILLSVFMVGPVTSRAIKKLEEDANSIYSLRHELRNQKYEERGISQLPRDEQSEQVHEINNEINQEVDLYVKKLDLPFKRGFSAGGTDWQTMASVMRRVGRANRATAITALVGGLFSTAASIWSLFV
ncbi:MAG: hypothetical protein ACTHYD_09630 [Canibacter sp.]